MIFDEMLGCISMDAFMDLHVKLLSGELLHDSEIYRRSVEKINDLHSTEHCISGKCYELVYV